MVYRSAIAGLLLCALMSLAGTAAEPADQEDTNYVLGPGDQVLIWALQAEELGNRSYAIDESGFLSLPLAGRIEAGGLTLRQLESLVAQKLSRYLVQPQVTASVVEYHSQPISVVGAVANPGVQQLRGRKTLLEALSAAGGLRADAGAVARVTRKRKWGALPLPGATPDSTGESTVAEVNVKALMASSRSAENVDLRPEDVISVPPAPTVYVIGEVAKPGGFPAGDERQTTALQILAMAGGVTRIAAPSKATILRFADGGPKRTGIPVDLKRILAGKQQDIQLEANDILFIPDSRGKRFTARMLDTLLSGGVSVATVGALSR